MPDRAAPASRRGQQTSRCARSTGLDTDIDAEARPEASLRVEGSGQRCPVASQADGPQAEGDNR